MVRLRPLSRVATAWLVVAGAALVGVASMPEADAAVSSGFEGGGNTNVVALDPHGTGILIAGADIGGLQVGVSNGASFLSRNAGTQFLADMSVATVVFASQSANVYAGTGNGTGPVSGFWRSQDGGQTWSRLGDGDPFPDFAGHGVPNVRPRSTGRLIALDESANPDGHPANIYAATTKGVMRSTDGGVTWAVIGLADVTRNLKGIAIDPADPSTVFVASYADGVYVSGNADAPDPTAVTFAQIGGVDIPGSPVYPEELLPISDTNGSSLYVAASGGADAGVYEYRTGGWLRWGQAVLGPATWYAIDGYSSGGQRHLVVGCHGRCPRDQVTGLHRSLFRSDDGGVTWTSLLPGPAGIHSDEVGGPGGPPWWLSEAYPQWMLGGPWYKVADLVIDPANRQRILVAGSQAIWRTEDGGANWYPAVQDLLVGLGFGVAVDPAEPNRVYTAAADWAMVYSTDRGVTVHQSRPNGGGTNGTAVAVDPVTGRVYLSLGRAEGTAGAEIYSSRDPSVPGTWTSEGLGSAPGEGGQRADGLVVGHGPYPVIVAAVVGSGIWRKVVKGGPGSGTWSQVLVHDDFGIEVRAAAVAGSPLVYVYDHTTTGGLWLSEDGGRTWGSDPIWTQPSPPGMTGFIAPDPSDPTGVYVSTASGLFVITDTTGNPTATQLTSFPDPTPGPVAVQGDGVVWVAGKAGDAAAADLYRSVDGGLNWESLGDDLYRNTATFPHALVVAPDGYLYAALRGNGLIVNPPVPRT